MSKDEDKIPKELRRVFREVRDVLDPQLPAPEAFEAWIKRNPLQLAQLLEMFPPPKRGARSTAPRRAARSTAPKQGSTPKAAVPPRVPRRAGTQKAASASTPKLTGLPADERAFAALVLSAARRSPTGWFGDDKVFINHVFRQLKAEGMPVGDIDDFKHRLVSAHRHKLISLSRADLFDEKEVRDVAESDTHYLSAVFNFVRVA